MSEAMMRRAMALAEGGHGSVGTNPLVGAVVVRKGKIVGEGFHARFGGPHAEAVALSRAGDRAKGGTLFVTLEPCAHLGKTPPCTRMVIASGVRNVIIGLPDPLQRGRGMAELRKAGIRVEPGVLADELAAQNHEWLARLKTRRPYLTLKLAMTLDGRIADFRGRSKWISSPGSRAWTRSLRSRHDAVLVGAGTVRTDDPGFTGRPRIVVAGRAGIPATSRILASGRTILAVARPPRRSGSAEVLVVPGRGGRVNLSGLLSRLYAMGFGSLVCEGGADLAGGLLRTGLVDRIVFVLAPVILGGTRALSAIGGPDLPLSRAVTLGPLTVTRLGPDLVCEADVIRRRG